MKSKVLKIGTVLLACVCLVSFMAVPVSAASSFQALALTNVAVFTNVVEDYIVEKIPTNTYRITIPYNSNKSQFASRWYITNPDLEKFYDYRFKVVLMNMSPYDMYLTINDVQYEFTKDLSSGDDVYFVDLTEFKYNQRELRVDFNFSFESSLKGVVLFSTWYRLSDVNTVIENDNKNTQAIIDAQQQATQEQTDEIMNGWDGGVNVDDGTKDEFANAEDAALGGKSDAEIQEEVNNALDFDVNVFDTTKIGKIHYLFDNVLDALGSSWQSLFVLSLTLGLGAFLIGRRYG